MIATQRPDADDLLLTITAGTTRPVRLGVRFHARRRRSPAQHRRDARRHLVRRCERHTRPSPPPGQALSPKKSGSNSPRGNRHDLHRQRQDVRRRAASRPVPAHIRSLAGPLRRQKGLRRRRLRRLHGVARRRPGAQLHHARVPRRRSRGHHDRGPRHAREPAPAAAAVPRRPRIPVRLLHRGHDHDLGDLHRRAEAEPAARAEGKPVPLHGISGDRGCDQRCRGDRGGRCPAARSAPASRRRPGPTWSPAAPSTRWTPRWRACCI